MRVNVKFNDFTVRKLKPNIFENYQLIEAATKTPINEDDGSDNSPETGQNIAFFYDTSCWVQISNPGPDFFIATIHYWFLFIRHFSVSTSPIPLAQHVEEEKMDESDDDDENRLCEWAGCNQVACLNLLTTYL